MNWSEFMDNLDNFLVQIIYGDKVTDMNEITPPVTQTVSNPPLTPPTTSNLAPQSLLDTFCGYIKLREGANPANNNPGNCKYYYGGYLPKYGVVTRNSHGFAVFSTYDLGWLYLENLVTAIIKEHPTLTFLQFFAGNGDFSGYSPADDDNDPISYATEAAQACGQLPTSLVDVILG